MEILCSVGRSELSKNCLDILAIVFLFNICHTLHEKKHFPTSQTHYFLLNRIYILQRNRLQNTKEKVKNHIFAFYVRNSIGDGNI